MPEGHALLTLQQLQHSGLEWKPLSGLKSLILTLLMIPMIHSLASLCKHTISHFHLKPSYPECHCPSKPRFTKGLFRVFRFSGIFSNLAISLRIRARGKKYLSDIVLEYIIFAC